MAKARLVVLTALLVTAVALQLGFMFLGWKDIAIPSRASQVDAAAVWPPPGIISLRLGELPVSGLSFLFSIPAVMLIAISYHRAGRRRAVGLAMLLVILLALLCALFQYRYLSELTGSFAGTKFSAHFFVTFGLMTDIFLLALIAQLGLLICWWFALPRELITGFLVGAIAYWFFLCLVVAWFVVSLV